MTIWRFLFSISDPETEDEPVDLKTLEMPGV